MSVRACVRARCAPQCERLCVKGKGAGGWGGGEGGEGGVDRLDTGRLGGSVVDCCAGGGVAVSMPRADASTTDDGRTGASQLHAGRHVFSVGTPCTHSAVGKSKCPEAKATSSAVGVHAVHTA